MNSLKKHDFFNFDEKSVEFFKNVTDSQIQTSLTQESDTIEVERNFEEKTLFSLLEDDFEKEMFGGKSCDRISTFDDNNFGKKISEIYPAFQKYSHKNINFLRRYLFNLQLGQKKEDSIVLMSVKEKLFQIQPKTKFEYIQVMKKLFNLYKVKKDNGADISKENVKTKFSPRKSQITEENLDELYNFKLPKESKILYDLMLNKKQKIIDIEDINVDEPSIKKKKVEWINIRKAKKSYYSMKIERDNSIQLSRNLYCE